MLTHDNWATHWAPNDGALSGMAEMPPCAGDAEAAVAAGLVAGDVDINRQCQIRQLHTLSAGRRDAHTERLGRHAEALAWRASSCRLEQQWPAKCLPHD